MDYYTTYYYTKLKRYQGHSHPLSILVAAAMWQETEDL